MTRSTKHQHPANRESKLVPLGQATKTTKGFWGAFREEAGSVSRFGVIP